MERICYNCGRGLDNEPAIRGLKGFLCFPCRYNFDRKGGERFLVDCQIYQEKQGDWEIKHKDKWVKYQRLKRFTEGCLYLITISLGSPFIFFLFKKENFLILIFCFIASFIFFIIRILLSLKAEKISYQKPPDPPRKDPNALLSFLDVVYDEEFIKKENPEFLRFKGYPPNWEEMKRNCLIRDGYKCRICGKVKRLHIHHIKPISYGGIHSLQNLITLCYTCHKAQEYYQHQGLITENIKAARRYWVSPHIRSDGGNVSGYFRKTGRKGAFWRKVRRVRSY